MVDVYAYAYDGACEGVARERVLDKHPCYLPVLYIYVVGPFYTALDAIVGKGIYEGESHNGIREGFGIYRWADGSVWFGYWEGGLREGEGLYINANGAMMAGIWSEGELMQ